MQHRKNMLMKKAVAYGIVGRSTMNKLELVSVLINAITDANELEKTFILLNEEQYSLCQQLRRSASLLKHEYMPYKYRFLIDQGIINGIFQRDHYEYFMPTEVKEALAELNWQQIELTREYQHGVLKYIKAAIHLYGAIKIELMIDIYNSYHAASITSDELLNIVAYHSKTLNSFYVNDGYFVNDYFEEHNMDELDNLLLEMKDKPYYRPSKEIFIQYEDSLYFEMTPQLMKLKHFICKELHQDEAQASMMIDEVQLLCSMGKPIQEVVNELTRRGVVFDKFDQVQQVASLIIDVYNTTRLWSNGGHTPVELAALKNEISSSGMKQSFNPVKIGRNEPCICGSGKKYKKCCGKDSL